MKLTVVFEDHRVSVKYANGVSKMVDFYTDHGGDEETSFLGNTVTRDAFTSTVSSVGHNMNDYWAIQYHGGQMEIEYANGHPNQVISSNTGLSEYVSLMETWRDKIDADEEEKERLKNIPSWDDIRRFRDRHLLASDKIIAWSTETGNAVPQNWTDYRQDLRDITTTYGANTGNTELVVWPTEPSWPST